MTVNLNWGITMDKTKIASIFAFFGGSIFFMLNITTEGAVPGGWQGGILGGGIGFLIGWIIASYFPFPNNFKTQTSLADLLGARDKPINWKISLWFFLALFLAYIITALTRPYIVEFFYSFSIFQVNFLEYNELYDLVVQVFGLNVKNLFVELFRSLLITVHAVLIFRYFKNVFIGIVVLPVSYTIVYTIIMSGTVRLINMVSDKPLSLINYIVFILLIFTVIAVMLHWFKSIWISIFLGSTLAGIWTLLFINSLSYYIIQDFDFFQSYRYLFSMMQWQVFALIYSIGRRYFVPKSHSN